MMEPATIQPLSLPALSLAERKGLPERPGLYFVLGSDGAVLYIGQASRSLRHRWQQHHREAELSRYDGCRIAWLYVDDVSLLDALEDACIAYFNPPLNRKRVGKHMRTRMLVRSDDLVQLAMRVPRVLKKRMRELAAQRDTSIEQQVHLALERYVAEAEREQQAV